MLDFARGQATSELARMQRAVVDRTFRNEQAPGEQLRWEAHSPFLWWVILRGLVHSNGGQRRPNQAMGLPRFPEGGAECIDCLWVGGGVDDTLLPPLLSRTQHRFDSRDHL